MRVLAEQWYEGLQRGELLIQACTACKKASMYPRTRCPFCHESALEWTPSSGRGQLFSFTVQRAGAPTGYEDEVPYALGVVRLDEDVQVLGRLLPGESGSWDAFSVDCAVELCEPAVVVADRPPAPWFRRA